MARYMRSGSGGDCPSATGRSAIRCKLKVFFSNGENQYSLSRFHCEREREEESMERGATYDIRPRVLGRENLARLGRGHLKVRDDGNRLDLLSPRKLDVVTDAVGGAWRLDTRVDAPGWCRQHLAEWDLLPRHILGLERPEVRSHEATEQGGADIVRVTFYDKQDQPGTICGGGGVFFLF